MAPRPAHRYSYDEYLAYERDSGIKHEYDGGEILAIAGGSRRHNALASRISATITNPTLLVEVLSPSTEQDDRGSKWQHYQQIPSLQEYVLVSQSQARIERYRRLPTGGWEYHDATEGTVQLSSGAALDLKRLHADLPH